MTDHKFLQTIPRHPNCPAVREITAELLNFYFKSKLGISRWRKLRPQAVTWTQGDIQHQSRIFGFRDLEAHIAKECAFNWEEFGLFRPDCGWLDDDLGFGWTIHHMDQQGQTCSYELTLPMGDQFPIKPKLDREGMVYHGIQSLLKRSILSYRDQLVSDSNHFTKPEWFNTLRLYVCDCVTLIDTLLQHIYLKAEFDPLPGWHFDISVLGHRVSRRLEDKLKWPNRITRRTIDALSSELLAINRLRQVRNHFQHFDPPCFAYSLEDVAEWLNYAQAVGKLAWRIRRVIDAPLTPELISLVVAPEVRFLPKDPTLPRKPHLGNSVYQSSCWPAINHTEEQDSVSSAISSPKHYGGKYAVILESKSSDSDDWSPAQSGAYSNETGQRSFRIRIQTQDSSVK